MLTCEAVISESAFLREGIDPGFRRLMGFLPDDSGRLSFDLNDPFAAVSALMAKYHDTLLSLADARLARPSERHDRARVFTLDSDFTRYRRHSRQAIPLPFPH